MAPTKSTKTVVNKALDVDIESTPENEEAQSMFVAVRIRPLSEKEKSSGQSSCCQVIDGKVVCIQKGAIAGSYLKSQAGALHEYGFDAAFSEEASQIEVYNKTTKPFLHYVLGGVNVTVFAYGATGAGKTHTLMGNARCDDAAAHAEAGIVPNAICDLFQILENKRASAKIGESWTLYMTYIEVYNEQVYDLLDGGRGKVLPVREDQEKGIVVVAGVTEKVVDSAEEVLEWLQFGNRNRTTEATMANSVSSRSHAVLQVGVKYSQRTDRGGEISTEAKLSLIDLAGSERASATNNRGVRLQEGANINRSLLALANCINALSLSSTSKKAINVKYRDSKLTHLLKSSLEGNCKLVMIANVNPSHLTFEDSHNTLKYANRAKNIKVNPVVMEKARDSSWLERETRLRSENTELKERVDYLERLVEQLKRDIKEGVIARGRGNGDAEDDLLDELYPAAPPAAHGSVSVSAPNHELDGVEVIRAHSPTIVRQIKQERMNQMRRRSSAHVPSQEEWNSFETKAKVRKNRASMCAEVLTTLLSLPQEPVLNDPTPLNLPTTAVDEEEEGIPPPPPKVPCSPRVKGTTPCKIPLIARKSVSKKRLWDEEEEGLRVEEQQLREEAHLSPWKGMFSDTMLEQALLTETMTTAGISPAKRIKATRSPLQDITSSTSASAAWESVSPQPLSGGYTFEPGMSPVNESMRQNTKKRRGSYIPKPKVRGGAVQVAATSSVDEDSEAAAPRRSARISMSVQQEEPRRTRATGATVSSKRKSISAKVLDENHSPAPETQVKQPTSFAAKVLDVMHRVTGGKDHTNKRKQAAAIAPNAVEAI